MTAASAFAGVTLQHLQLWCAFLGLAAAVTETKEARRCPAPTNSTEDLLRCLDWRQQTGESDFEEVSQTPTEAADNQAVEYFEEIARNRQRGWLNFDPQVTIFTDEMLGVLKGWTDARNGLPQVFSLGEFDRACQYMEESVGFRYSMEHWVHRIISSNTVMMVEDVEAADFVFLPHCATGVFMHMVVQDDLRRQRRQGTENALNSSRRLAETYLGYEGNLPASTVVRLDRSYLMNKVQKVWQVMPEFWHCWRRESCKFLIASIYARHVWRNFASHFADKIVFITHGGMSPWLRQQPDRYFLRVPGDATAWVPPDGNKCRASCELHCQMEPPAILPQDIVLPWVVAFEWTQRAETYRHRDILAFYSGTRNSCSRTVLQEVFGGRFESEMGLREDRRRERSAKSPLKDRVLIFPPEFRLRQQDWSELAFRSKLCICPDGDSPNTGRLIEVIMHGCVPLIISNRLQPPFHQLFDWSKIAFFMREDALPHLPRILEQFEGPEGDRRIREKRHRLGEMSHLLDYARDGVASTLLLALRERALDLRRASSNV